MAESDDKYPQKRGNYATNRSNRSRPGYNRPYNNLGVRDLREILDKKRQERGNDQDNKVPPPDPSYNYLKDPLRESGEESSNYRKNYNKKAYNKNQHHRFPETNTNKTIERPFNIKVEFSTSTGEHVYTVDENTTLPDIKHVPDRNSPPQRRNYNSRNDRGRGWRGRGRGDGRSDGRGDYQRSYHTRTINRNRNYEGKYEEKEANHKQFTSVPNEHSHSVYKNVENWDDNNDGGGDGNTVGNVVPNCDNNPEEVWDDAVANPDALSDDLDGSAVAGEENDGHPEISSHPQEDLITNLNAEETVDDKNDERSDESLGIGKELGIEEKDKVKSAAYDDDDNAVKTKETRKSCENKPNKKADGLKEVENVEVGNKKE